MILLAGAKTSHADTDPRSIAVPLIGTQGAASQYPSTLIVNPIGGPVQTGPVSVVLHRVSHPCPEHLAVLLVHDAPGGGKFLLMSNAGGCRPLQGTDIVFSGAQAPLPDSEPVSPPHGNQVEISASKGEARTADEIRQRAGVRRSHYRNMTENPCNTTTP